jgi:hypothetical protein
MKKILSEALPKMTPKPTHDTWFRAMVREALDDLRPLIPHEEAEAHFAKRRAAAERMPVVLTTEEEEEALTRSEVAAARGEFATDAEVRRVWAKHGL